MKRLGAAVVISLVLTSIVAIPSISAGGPVPDAAHACQQGGYATLHGSDGTTFKNVGECVSYVARGGTIPGVSATCTYISGTSGCVRFDDVALLLGGTGPSSTTLAGMFTFAPPTDWSVWVVGSTAITVTGSGTWVASTGQSGTWTATHVSSIYPGRFYNYDTSTGTSTPAADCGSANTREVGVHFDVYENSTLVGAIEMQVRNATWGTNFVLYQGFAEPIPVGAEPWGVHNTTNVSGVTFQC